MSPSIEFFAVASVLMGYSMMMILNNANAAMQTTVEGHLRGRVMSVYGGAGRWHPSGGNYGGLDLRRCWPRWAIASARRPPWSPPSALMLTAAAPGESAAPQRQVCRVDH